MDKKKEKKQKKPFYKKWWFIAIVVIGVISAISGGGDKDEAKEEVEEQDVVQEEAEEQEKEEVEEEADISKESEQNLSDEELENIMEQVKEQISADAEFEDFDFTIDSYEFDQEQNTLKTTAVVSDDPLPNQEEAEEFTDNLAWYIGTATSDKDFNVRVISSLKFGDDEYTPLGSARFEDGETTFKEDEGLEILD